MFSLLQLIIFFACLLMLGYFRASRWVWFPVTAGLLAIMSACGTLSWLFLGVCWILFLATSVLLIPPLRRLYFSSILLNYFKRNLPSISQTEQEVLEAGDTWWEADLFTGKPNWANFLALKEPNLSSEEQEFLDNEVEELCRLIDDWNLLQKERKLSEELWHYLKRKGFLGLVLSKEHGGLGFSAFAHSAVISKIASRSISVAVMVMVPNSLGPGELLSIYGTKKQQDYYLPRLATGEEIPCFGLTSPEAGSDASALIDNGVICRDIFEGETITGIRLNWNKRYITLAPVATLVGLAVKLYDPEHLLGTKDELGITLCLVPTSMPGVKNDRYHSPLHLAIANGPISGKDVFIPLDWVIGGPEKIGQGWKMLMECLSIGRAISLPAMGTAACKLSYRMTGAYTRIREQFSLPIARFEGVQASLAKIAGFTYLADATRLLTLQAIEEKKRPAIASAIAKYHITEMGRTVINAAMDLHGGKGIQTGPRNYLAGAYIASPVSITVEGANILTRNLIIFGQGLMRCHPYIRAEIQATTDEDAERGSEKFDKLLFSHTGYAISNFARSFVLGLSRAKFSASPVKGVTADYYRQLTRMSTALAFVSDVSILLLGGKLKQRESLSARLGDVLSYLYMASAVLKYSHNNKDCDEDISSVHWGVSYCLYKIQTAFDDYLRNFPICGVGPLLRFILFPWGRSYKKPTDKVAFAMVEPMLSPSVFRERLTGSCFVGKTADDPTGRVEFALKAVTQAEAAEKKIRVAMREGKLKKTSIEESLAKAMEEKIINDVDENLIKRAIAARFDVIQVDDFSSPDCAP